MQQVHPSRVIFAILLAATYHVSFGQPLQPGPQVLTFYSDVDDTEQPYALYLPENFDASKKYPLVISLHGAGSNHRLNLRRVFGKSNAEGENDVEASRYFPEWEGVDYIVASPYARGTMGYQGIAEKDVLDVLADVKRRFPIDEDRTYLTGLSMGGGGTLWLGLTRPDLWAAIAPVCPAPPGGTDALAGNALNVPVHIFQGGADPVVRPEGVRAWVERFKELGVATEYTEYPGVSHNSWENAYADGQIFDWFGQYRRNPHPERVRFASSRYANNSAYWVRLGALTPGTLASIDAQFTAANHLSVTTADLDGFTLILAGHPRFTPGSALTISIDGTTVHTDAADAVSFSRQGGAWVQSRFEPSAQEKRPGAEGPIDAAIASRHLYVYGTGGNPSNEALAERRRRAEQAAEWSVYRGPFWGRVMVFPRVAADREVRPSDLASSNLVLFGTKETNSLIERFSDRLPLHLAADAADEYGLVYIFPIDGHYVLVNAGLPWWQTDGSPPGGNPFTNSVPAFGLMTLGDYRLFKGSANDVVAEGRFDTRWRLPEAGAEKMTATGAVMVHGDGMMEQPE